MRPDHAHEVRALDIQIAALHRGIEAAHAKLRRDGEMTNEEAHAVNELRVELAQRRARRDKLIAGPVRNVLRNLDIEFAKAGVPTHVIVGDHDPELRNEYRRTYRAPNLHAKQLPGARQ